MKQRPTPHVESVYRDDKRLRPSRGEQPPMTRAEHIRKSYFGWLGDKHAAEQQAFQEPMSGITR